LGVLHVAGVAALDAPLFEPEGTLQELDGAR
jgi:hypothetical protein